MMGSGYLDRLADRASGASRPTIRARAAARFERSAWDGELEEHAVPGFPAVRVGQGQVPEEAIGAERSPPRPGTEEAPALASPGRPTRAGVASGTGVPVAAPDARPSVGPRGADDRDAAPVSAIRPPALGSTQAAPRAPASGRPSELPFPEDGGSSQSTPPRTVLAASAHATPHAVRAGPARSDVEPGQPPDGLVSLPVGRPGVRPSAAAAGRPRASFAGRPVAEPAGRPAAPPVIEVTIGRVEVHATAPTVAATPVREPPALSLDAYLEQRSGRP